MKQKKTAAAVIAAMLAGFAAAKAPEIDPALVDTLVAQIMQQADRHAEQSQRPDGQAIRNDAVHAAANFGSFEKQGIEGRFG